jgi:UDP-glucose 4-epimerase
MSEMTVLVTGGSGFVARAVLNRLVGDGAIRARAATRQPALLEIANVASVTAGELGADQDWTSALRGVDVLVHTAARVHVMRDSAADPLAEFRRANVAGTVALARQAAAIGVRRLVFISSIKVNGESTETGKPYDADSPAAPRDPYGQSKLEAELALWDISAETGLEVVIIRPVLVYGPGVRGNFRSMMQWLRRGIPLPLGAIHNRRSLIAVENLAAVIGICTRHQAAAGQTFLVSDGEDISTPDLLRRTALALNVRARLIPVPVGLLKVAGRLLRRRAAVERLTGSLQVDIDKTRRLLDWAPRLSIDEALLATAAHFLRTP